MIRILIVDDHRILREGLKQLLANTGIEVAGEAEDSGKALEALRRHKVDLVVLDVSIPGSAGEELISRIHAHHPGLPILMLTMHKEPQIAYRKLKAGAAGYVTKDSDPDVLIAAIRRVAAGGRFIPPDLAEQIAFESFSSPAIALHDTLSQRELQILRLLASGKTVNDIADQLSISNKTVSTYKFRLMKKLNVDSNAKLMHYALSHGLAEY